MTEHERIQRFEVAERELRALRNDLNRMANRAHMLGQIVAGLA